jgi:tetratricopeptide (TPR) repeat protein
LAGETSETRLADKVVADALCEKGNALLAQKKPMAAVESYQKLLERFEPTMPLAHIRYRVGQILFDRGDLKGAADTWGRLQGTPQDFLWKIGQEKLSDSQWRDDYKKYTGRIPAMATKGGRK